MKFSAATWLRSLHVRLGLLQTTKHCESDEATKTLKHLQSAGRTNQLRRELDRFAAIRVEVDGAIFYPSQKLQEEYGNSKLFVEIRTFCCFVII